MNKLRARAIIPYKGGILLIHRIKELPDRKVEYYVIPGGGVEGDETLEECVTRELLEELSINIEVVKELYRLNNEDDIEVFFLCNYLNGEIKLGNGPEFKEDGRGIYIPTVVEVEELENIILLEEVKQALREDLKEYKEFKNIPTRQL